MANQNMCPLSRKRINVSKIAYLVSHLPSYDINMWLYQAGVKTSYFVLKIHIIINTVYRTL